MSETASSHHLLSADEDLERTRLLVRCAQLYYGLVPGAGGELRQSDVARRLGVPRSQVVLWLKEAREKFIEIRLRAPRAAALELPLAERLSSWGVREVQVVLDGGLSEEGTRRAVGEAAGRRLRSALVRGARVGLAGGRTLLWSVREATRGGPLPRLSIFPLTAGGPLPLCANAHVALLAGAAAPGSGAVGLWVPPLRPGRGRGDLRSFLRRIEVRAVYRAAQEVDVALIGVGATQGPEGIQGMRDYLGATKVVAERVSRGAARGFILQQFVDAEGRDHPCALGERNLAVPLSALRRMTAAHPRRPVILAASGRGKTPAVAAAARGRLASVLVVDAALAEGLLEEFHR
jgi:DNA-binding transcriptional regulator LsrR (DeoR family)